MLIMPAAILAIEDENDREYMEWMFKQYHRLMYSEIGKILRNNWDTEDVMQDCVEKMIDKLQLLRGLGDSQRINYIITICKNKAISHLRKASTRREVHVDDWWEDDLVDNSAPPEELLLHQEEIERLAQIWDELSQRDQYLLAGRYILEDSYEETGRELGTKPASVRMLVTRAKRNARTLMEKDT